MPPVIAPAYRPNRIKSLMPPLQGIPAAGTSGTATLELPIGMRYHGLTMEFDAATTIGELTAIRIYINGGLAQNWTPTHLNTLNMFDGVTTFGTNQILRIPFDRFRIKNQILEEETAINTWSKDANAAAITSFSMQVDITAAGGHTMSCNVFAERTNPVPGGAGIIPYVIRNVYSIAGAINQYPITDFFQPGKKDRSAMWRAVFVPSANTLDNFLIKKGIEGGTAEIFKSTDLSNRQDQADFGCRFPQASQSVIDFSMKGYGAEVLDFNDAKSLEIDLDASGAMTLVAYYQMLGSL